MHCLKLGKLEIGKIISRKKLKIKKIKIEINAKIKWKWFSVFVSLSRNYKKN